MGVITPRSLGLETQESVQVLNLRGIVVFVCVRVREDEVGIRGGGVARVAREDFLSALLRLVGGLLCP